MPGHLLSAPQIWAGAWATTHATTKSATTSRACGAQWEAQRDALATVRRFNARLSAKGYVWFWPKIAAALTSKHHWLVIACDSCDTVVDLDLRVKPRDPEAASAWRCVTCMPALQRPWPAAHHCAGAAAVGLIQLVKFGWGLKWQLILRKLKPSSIVIRQQCMNRLISVLHS